MYFRFSFTFPPIFLTSLNGRGVLGKTASLGHRFLSSVSSSFCKHCACFFWICVFVISNSNLSSLSIFLWFALFFWWMPPEFGPCCRLFESLNVTKVVKITRICYFVVKDTCGWGCLDIGRLILKWIKYVYNYCFTWLRSAHHLTFTWIIIYWHIYIYWHIRKSLPRRGPHVATGN